MDEKLTDFAPAEKEKLPRLMVDAAETTGGGDDFEDGAHQANEQDELIGQIVAETFELQKCLGRGGMGVVYKAKHVILGKVVALKLLHQMRAKEPDVVARFRREAVAISSLDHPNIVRLNAFGVDKEDRAYLVMDLVDGKPLSDLIKERGRLLPLQALEITSQVLAALEHAHDQHMIHRDIKPSNIMVVENDDGSILVKMVDFGLAKIVGVDAGASESQNMSLTKTGDVLGSPYYMSPEQCIGDPLDERSDIYSTGCVLYEMLHGRPPFDAANVLKVLHLHTTSAHKPLEDSKLSPQLLKAINSLINTALAKDIAARYPDAYAMQSEIEKIKRADWSAPALARDTAAYKKGVSSANDSFDRNADFYAAPRTHTRRREKEKQPATNRRPLAPSAVLSGGKKQKKNGFDSAFILFAAAASVLMAMTVRDAFKLNQHQESIANVGNQQITHPAKLQPTGPQADLSLTNIKIIDPVFNQTHQFYENLGSRRLMHSANLAIDPETAKGAHQFSLSDSTIDGGLPIEIPSYRDFSDKMEQLQSLQTNTMYSSALVKLQLADYAYECGDMVRALSIYQKLLNTNQIFGAELARVWSQEGDCYAHLGRYDCAEQSYLTALKNFAALVGPSIESQNALLNLKLAYCAEAIGVDQEAAGRAQTCISTILQIPAGKRSSAGVQTTLGDAYLFRKDYKNALKAFREAREKTVSQPGMDEKYSARISLAAAYLDLRIGKTYLALNNPKAALQAMSDAENKIAPFSAYLAPPDEPTVRGEVQPRISYIKGLAYQQIFEASNSKDRASRKRAVDNFIKALEISRATYPHEKNQGFIVMCLMKLSELGNYSENAGADLELISSYMAGHKPLRCFLPPEILRDTGPDY